MDISRIAILCNPFSGSGRDKIFELTQKAFNCLSPQVEEIFTGPGEMGEVVCKGKNVAVFGRNDQKSRYDTIETTKRMVDSGAELFVIVAGDGTYNDAIEGMKAMGVTLPIFGIAGGRFNTIFPKRKHDPFVSMRGDFKPFSLSDLVVEDVMGILSRVNGEIVSYGFFWGVVCNLVAYTDKNGNFMTIDAAQYLDGKVVPREKATPIATDRTRIAVVSKQLGEIELASGRNISLPIVAHIVAEINQIVAGGFGMFANIMDFHGIAYYFTNPDISFMPGPEYFPVETRSIGFFAGDQVRYTGLNTDSVFQVDSTAICKLSPDDVLTAEIVLDLGKKAVVKTN